MAEPLPPIVPLPASSRLAGATRLTWHAITATGRSRFLKSDIDAWQAENARLAQRVLLDDDDEALMNLVRRDPRYLGTEIVAGKALLWKLQVVHGLSHARRGALRHRSTAEIARKNLERLGATLAFVTGRGNQQFMNHHLLLLNFEECLAAVQESATMIASGESTAKIAKVTKLPVSEIEKIRAFPRKMKEHAERLTLERYLNAFGVARLRTMLHDARHAVDAEE